MIFNFGKATSLFYIALFLLSVWNKLRKYKNTYSYEKSKRQSLPHYFWIYFLGRSSNSNTQDQNEHVVKWNTESICPTAHVLLWRLQVLASNFNRTTCNGPGLKILPLLKICSYPLPGQKNEAHILILQNYNHYILSLMICPMQFLSFLIFYHNHCSIFCLAPFQFFIDCHLFQVLPHFCSVTLVINPLLFFQLFISLLSFLSMLIIMSLEYNDSFIPSFDTHLFST